MRRNTPPTVESADANHATPTDDELISASIRALAAGRGVRNAELAPILGINRASVFNKLNGTAPWKASEVGALARYFDVSTDDIFNGLGLFGGNAKSLHRDSVEALSRVRHQGLEPRTR
ncbi:helix-turn-helix domain-containing protein [Devriesea agamarum]|uniref:helix-turn-helix domain-containing protein n=1 Tax=Devriesea agamarum TaxID=472569 RepID=UPI0009FDB4F5|nr:helix-turn-helix domain-containing protein [Devriesea agamarum]